MLGLWSRSTAKPEVIAEAGGCEICFVEEDVDGLYGEWVERGIPIAQAPSAMNGMNRTFVALDPDGHRIRIFCLEEAKSG